MRTTNKPKIQKTNRIRLRRGTIYCSSKIIQAVKEHIQRCEQVFAPVKGELPALMNKLRSLASEPETRDHFPESSRLTIEANIQCP